MKLYHNSWSEEYREPFGAAQIGTVVKLSLDIEDAPGVRAYLRLWREGYGETGIELFPDKKIDSNCMRYSTSLQMPNEPSLIWYYFIVEYGSGFIFYGNNHNKTGGEGKEYKINPVSYQITVYQPAETPNWFKNSICYQIFPDRFARDDNWRIRAESAINLRNKRIGDNNTSEIQRQFIEDDWYKPAYYVKDENGNVTDWPFYCGSLKGIESKLDYLRTMGVTSIYLNPIFEAVSNHRYDTADYTKIDPILGNEQDFRNLCKAAKERGISIILDGVFSHTGADSVYFDKFGNYGGHGAYTDTESKYRYWYKFDDEEETGYKSWWGVRDLPEVKEDNAFFRKMIVGEGGVLKKWIKAGAKGFRLDVADELPDEFIELIRKSIKEESDDNVLIGEVWEDASNKISYDEVRRYLSGKELDSTMNYPLRQILLDYINYTISSGDAAAMIMSLKENYPSENFYGALNLVGTHDRTRILTELAGDQDYDSACKKVKIMSTLQYALPGVPCIYYGDEIGMMGHTDPENRSAFLWDQARQNGDLAYHYRMLGLIYDQHPALKGGEIDLLSGKYSFIPDDVLAFIRYDDNEQILVMVNRSYGDNYVDMGEFAISSDRYALDLLNSEEFDLTGLAHLPALSVKVVLIRDKKPVVKEKPRRTGVICHISSLPGGTLGKPAREFVDWLAEIGIKVWQVLPLNPCGKGGCPYNSYSAFAGNTDFINRNELPQEMQGIRTFVDNNRFWLDEYVDFVINQEIKVHPEYADRNQDEWKSKLKNDQYYFHKQWMDLKAYANKKGIQLMGDLPMFLDANSVDVHYHPELFQADENGNLTHHAGVPGDYFNPEGQNWGLALYNWDEHKKTGYEWWINRIKQCADRYDIVRLDHFRGFSQYFAIPEGHTPQDGTWLNGPGSELFDAINDVLEKEDLDLEIIAEDLGQLDNGVMNLIKLTGYKGMNIWQFSANEMLNMRPDEAKDRVFYSGTHDNQTLVGWLKSNNPADTDDRQINVQALDSMDALLSSGANLVILQLQDILLLDDSARMNVPGKPTGNWTWNFAEADDVDAFNEKVLQMSQWISTEIDTYTR